MIEPCPCCAAHAGASPHAELRFVCDVCGGPRVPRVDPTLRSSGREVPLLRKADAARKARAGWQVAAIADGVLLPFTLLCLAATVLLFGAGIAMTLVALFAVAPVASFLAFALHRAGVRGHEIAPALDAAWLAVATDVAQQTPGLTASVLAQKLGIEEPQAEELMALLDVNGAFTLGETPRPRLRFDEAVPMGAPAPDPPAASGAPSPTTSVVHATPAPRMRSASAPSSHAGATTTTHESRPRCGVSRSSSRAGAMRCFSRSTHASRSSACSRKPRCRPMVRSWTRSPTTSRSMSASPRLRNATTPAARARIASSPRSSGAAASTTTPMRLKYSSWYSRTTGVPVRAQLRAWIRRTGSPAR